MSIGERSFSSDPEHVELDSYRTHTPWAIVSLPLGLLSGLALLSSLLWILPLAAVVTAGVALWQISRQSPRMLGRGMALMGLALGLVFGTAAVARVATRHYWLETRAIAAVDQWFEFLRDDKPEWAYTVTQPPIFRQELQNGLRENIKHDPEASQQFESFLARSDIAAIVNADKGGFQIVRRQATLLGEDASSDRIYCRYELHFALNGKPMQMTLGYSVDRYVDSRTGESVWRIRGAELFPVEPSPRIQ